MDEIRIRVLGNVEHFNVGISNKEINQLG